MKKSSIIILLVTVLMSCSGHVDELKDEIMQGHDEVMGKMGKVKKLELTLIDLPDSIATLNDSTMIVKHDLESSNNWMNQWMREYDMESTDEEYLKGELKKVNEMSDYINKSITNAEKILSTINN